MSERTTVRYWGTKNEERLCNETPDEAIWKCWTKSTATLTAATDSRLWM
jgi:hypothetical protein